MACLKSLTKYDKKCSKVKGGASHLWLVSHSDLKNITGSLLPYEVDETGNLITEISLAASKLFVSVGTINNTLGITEEYTSTLETNSYDITTTLNLTISGISVESRTFVTNLIEAGDVAALIRLRSGRFVAIGLDGYMSVSTISGSTGVLGGDLNGYTISLVSAEDTLMRLVDPVIVPTITEA